MRRANRYVLWIQSLLIFALSVQTIDAGADVLEINRYCSKKGFLHNFKKTDSGGLIGFVDRSSDNAGDQLFILDKNGFLLASHDFSQELSFGHLLQSTQDGGVVLGMQERMQPEGRVFHFDKSGMLQYIFSVDSYRSDCYESVPIGLPSRNVQRVIYEPTCRPISLLTQNSGGEVLWQKSLHESGGERPLRTLF